MELGRGDALGHGGYNPELIPRKIQHTGFANIISISAGSRNSMALDQNGNVWSWGDGRNNFLGHG